MEDLALMQRTLHRSATLRAPEFVNALPELALSDDVLPRAIVFDLDGTLVDSVEDIAAILNRILRERGVAAFSASEVKLLMGEGISALIRKALRIRGLDATEADLQRLAELFLDFYSHDPVALTTPFPWALDVLSGLAGEGVAIGVCTNKAEKPARLVLERLGFATHVRAVIGGDSGFGQKPDPGPLLACASRLGIPASQLVYVGDHSIDVETARAANVPVVAAAYGYAGTTIINYGADRVIWCLSELPIVVHGLTEEPCRAG
jgi:phosphoglycolate phosphatase